ncbi:glutamate--cysteine ligase [Rhodococcus erythropolis]|uniref:carboxylate-amine ligase n=1 Tax=Rhodococcus erythropolis TaxID=1833 RepID=UPI001E2C0A72|nr:MULTISPECIES: glutamate--cysteine ligase [Rhodococcus erythropolis group]MCD2106247.1 glutamate--cysteine ligase [Rhodococcus qingshengii]MCZ4524672.1 glutamate--cysteine ligase [Rhodococcus erythropolis]
MSATCSTGSTAGRYESNAPTVGVEEEFILVDPTSWLPSTDSAAVAETASTLGLDLQLELSRCQVETNSPVCRSIDELRTHLIDMRRLAGEAAESNGCRLLAVGAPLSGPSRFAISDSPRYRQMGQHFGALAAEQSICGCHIHVGVADRAEAVQVCNHVRIWLPALLALSANSRIHQGVDTDFSSWRAVQWSRWPVAGPPPFFETADDFDTAVAMMVDCGVMLDKRMAYWDIRPSCHLPTVEIRVCDVQPTVDDAVLLATLVRALVATALRAVDNGVPASRASLERLRIATWVSAKEGILGKLIDPVTAHRISATEMFHRLLIHLRDSLDETGEYASVESALRRKLVTGSGSDWQHRTLRQVCLRELIARAVRRTLPTAQAGMDTHGGPTPDQ